MAMQVELWSLSALAVEFNMDRRTVASRLKFVPPAEEKTVGKRTEKRWKLIDVVEHLHIAPDQLSDEQEDEAIWNRTKQLIGQWLAPSMLSSDRYLGMLIASLEKRGYTRVQTLEIYSVASVAVCYGIADVCGDMDVQTGQVMESVLTDADIGKKWAGLEYS